MDAGHKRYLEKRHAAQRWVERSHTTQLIKKLTFDDVALKGWTLVREAREQSAHGDVLQAIFAHGHGHDHGHDHNDVSAELLRVDLIECATIKSANEQLLEVLGNIESDTIERQTGSHALGEVAFALDDTTAVFRRANIVCWFRNAGRTRVSVVPMARAVDKMLLGRLGTTRKR